MKLYVARDENGKLYLHPVKPFLANVKPSAYWNNEEENWMQLRETEFPELTFDNSPLEVRLMREDVVNANYQSIADYEDFLGLVSCMRKAQRDQEIISARVMYKREQGYNLTDEDFTELANATNKVVELEEAVDKFIEERT